MTLLSAVVPAGVLLSLFFVAWATKLLLPKSNAPWPLRLILAAGFLGVAAAALFAWPASLLKVATGLLFSLAGTYITTKYCEFTTRRGVKLPRRAIVVLALVGGTLFAGNVVIGFANGWHLSETGASPYFRFPFNDIVERNTILVETLSRQSKDSPYLANTKLTFRVFWHSFATFFLPADKPHDIGPLVAGVSRATGLLLMGVLAWLTLALRPGLLLRVRTGVPLILVFALHSDIYHAVLTLLLDGGIGMQADGSLAQAGFYRHASLSFLELVTPHHLFFFFFAVPCLALLYYGRRLGARRAGLAITALAVFAFQASPILFLLFVAPTSLWYAVRRKQLAPVKGLALQILCGGLAYQILFGRSIVKILARLNGIYDVQLLPMIGWGWALSPLVAVATLGVLGILLMLWIAGTARQGRSWQRPWLGVLLLALLLGNYVVTSPEIKRHIGWVSLFLSFFFLVDVACRRNLNRLARASLACLALALPLHGYYLYSFLAKPSVIAHSPHWKDYFEVGEFLQRNARDAKVMAAVSPQYGVSVSPLTRFTTAFSIPSHALIHADVPRRFWPLLRRAELDTTPVPYGLALGYNGILWDPVAEEVWGPKVKERFIDEKNLVVRYGSVALYHLEDKLKRRNEDLHLLADRLHRKGFDFEAVTVFNAIPPALWTTRTHEGVARSLRALGATNSARVHASLAEGLEPKVNQN